MVQFGRIILDPDMVCSVVRDGKAKTTTVNLTNGGSHTFSKYWKEVWEHFKGIAS